MIKCAATLVALCCLPALACAQPAIGGQTAVQFYKSASLSTPRSVNGGKPGFGWQSVLYVTEPVTDDIAALATLNVTDNGSFALHYLALRIADISPLQLEFQAGRFDLPFGNLGERRYPRRNPLYGLPLMHEYRTALPDNVSTESQLLDNRGQGRGMRLLDMGMYDLGAMISGSAGILDYAIAFSSGTVSATTYGVGNTNNDLTTTLRLAVTPATGLTIGAAYMWGAYLETPGQPPPRGIDINSYIQKSAELDVEYSSGHLVLDVEGVYSVYPVPLESRDERFPVFGFTGEGRYTIFPRFFAALRFGGLRFGSVLLGGVVQPWDYNVNELEGGVGYFLARDVLLKVVHRETRTQGGSRPKDSLTALQIVGAY